MRLVLLSPTLGLFFQCCTINFGPFFFPCVFQETFFALPLLFRRSLSGGSSHGKKLNEVAAVERASSKKCVLFSAINVHVVSPCQLWANITWLSIDFEGFMSWLCQIGLANNAIVSVSSLVMKNDEYSPGNHLILHQRQYFNLVLARQIVRLFPREGLALT